MAISLKNNPGNFLANIPFGYGKTNCYKEDDFGGGGSAAPKKATFKDQMSCLRQLIENVYGSETQAVWHGDYFMTIDLGKTRLSDTWMDRAEYAKRWQNRLNIAGDGKTGRMEAMRTAIKYDIPAVIGILRTATKRDGRPTLDILYVSPGDRVLDAQYAIQDHIDRVYDAWDRENPQDQVHEEEVGDEVLEILPPSEDQPPGTDSEWDSGEIRLDD